jgi:hypothetical protein
MHHIPPLLRIIDAHFHLFFMPPTFVLLCHFHKLIYCFIFQHWGQMWAHQLSQHFAVQFHAPYFSLCDVLGIHIFAAAVSQQLHLAHISLKPSHASLVPGFFYFIRLWSLLRPATGSPMYPLKRS